MIKFCILFLCSTGVLSAYSAECQAFFSQRDQMANRLIDLIDREKSSIKVAVYCLGHKEIAAALVRAKERGVLVEVIVDPTSLRTRASLGKLAKAGIPVFVWESQQTKRGARPLMHDKFCVFGNALVWTGSFNFTYAASLHHQENAVTIESREVAQQYLEQFAKMQIAECKPFQHYLDAHPKKPRRKSA